MGEQKIQHDAHLLRFRHSKNPRALSRIRLNQRESSDTPN
jgi:hypothetical protein